MSIVFNIAAAALIITYTFGVIFSILKIFKLLSQICDRIEEIDERVLEIEEKLTNDN